MGGHEMAIAIRGMGGMCNKVCTREPGEEVGLCPVGSPDKVTTKFTYIGSGNGQYEVLEMRGGSPAADGPEAPPGPCARIFPCCRGKGRLRREIVVLTFVLVSVIALLLAVSISARGSGTSSEDAAARGPVLDFKCDNSATWQSAWSDAKKDWCCQRFPPVGCPANQDIWAQADRPTPSGDAATYGDAMPVGGGGAQPVGGGAQPVGGGPVPTSYPSQVPGASVLADA